MLSILNNNILCVQVKLVIFILITISYVVWNLNYCYKKFRIRKFYIGGEVGGNFTAMYSVHILI